MAGRSLLLALSLLGVACSDEAPRTFTARDAGADVSAMDAATTPDVPVAPPPCPANTWRCDGLLTAIRCDAEGNSGAPVACSGGTTCINGVGCAACRPGDARCSTDEFNLPQRCLADGSGWETFIRCDEVSGERCVDGACQRPCDMASGNANSYLGCEYWSTVTANAGLNQRFTFAAVLSNPSTMEAHVTVDGGPLTDAITRTIAPGGVSLIELPWVNVLKGSTPACFPLPLDFLNCSARSSIAHVSDRNGAFHISSDVPVAAYQFNPLEYRVGEGSAAIYSYTNDASLLLPQRVLGDARNHDYIVVTRPNWQAADSDGPPWGAFVAIVSGAPTGTPVEVEVTTRAWVSDPRQPLRELAPGTYTYPLARGEVLQLIGTRTGQDLTGSRVRANGPIAVFTGHDCTNVPAERTACDHLEEQLFPAATWGRRYAVTALRDRVADPDETSVVRVVSQADNNTLHFEGISTPPECDRRLDAGDFCEFETSGSFIVTGDRPLMVAQFMIGLSHPPQCQAIGAVTTERDDCVGDPAMVFEVPTEQYRSRYDLLIPSTYRFNFVNVVLPVGATVNVDGAAPDPMTVRGPFPLGDGLEYRVLALTPGSHALSTAGGEPFGAKVYGVALWTSYMYPGGLDLRPINPPG